MKKLLNNTRTLLRSEQKSIRGGALPTLFYCNGTNQCYTKKSICLVRCALSCSPVTSCPWD
jgi:hypothetical protein